MRLLLVCILVTLLVGCANEDSSESSTPAVNGRLLTPDEQKLVGDYCQGNGQGPLALTLAEGGTFTCRLFGCLGVYNTTRGKWSCGDGKSVVVYDVEADKMFEDDEPGHLSVVKSGDVVGLVRESDIQELGPKYLEHCTLWRVDPNRKRSVEAIMGMEAEAVP